jgi:hypothetical protein
MLHLLLTLACLCIGAAAWGAEPALLPDDQTPLNLRSAANFGFADTKAGDGVGGWSDQGPDNSFENFPLHEPTLAGIPFQVIDPATNQGRSVVSFRHQSLATGAEQVLATLETPRRARWLYLLHSSCWGGLPAGTIVGPIRVRTTAGNEQVFDIQAGRDIADWWQPKPQPNAVVAVQHGNSSATVGAFASRFDLGSEATIASVTFRTTGRALWIVVAATLTRSELPLQSEADRNAPVTMTANREWQPIDTTHLLVQPGSALDFTTRWDGKPAGSHGRVITRPDGHLAFADTPDTPVRFSGAVMFPELELNALDDAEIDNLATAVQRQGYNLVRPHFLDNALTGNGVPGGEHFVPRALDRWDRLALALKQRGIYLYIDAMSSVSGYTPGYAWTPEMTALDFKRRIWGEPAVRNLWREQVRAFLTHRNPYTGTTLAEDPQVAVVLGYNEQEHNLFAWGIPESLLPGWRAFLSQRYGTFDALDAAWGKHPQGTTFTTLPLFTTSEIWDRGALGRDIAEFLAQGESELLAWYRQQLADMGYHGLFTQFDYLQSRRYLYARSQVDVVSMHGYHAHPSSGKEPASRISQASSLGDALNWWRAMGAMRLAGKPFMITEAGHVYWNRYRHEEGLALGSYASLQGVDALFGFSWNVALTGRPIWPFYIAFDPIARASQVVAGLLHGEQRIRIAAHRIDLNMNRQDAIDHPENGVDGDRSRLGLVTGLAVRISGTAALPAADLTLTLGKEARIANDKMVVSTVDTVAGGFTELVSQLRRSGILPTANRTDAAHGRFASDTGEILLDTGAQTLAVTGRGVAGLCCKLPFTPQVVGPLHLTAATVPAAVTVASLDGADISLSHRLLLIIATDARNSGEVYDNQSGTVLRRIGNLPVLLRTGSFALDITRAATAPALTIWSLAQDGTRQEQLAARSQPGSVQVAVDTAALTKGPSVFFELVAQP